jgi:hypothetical protein
MDIHDITTNNTNDTKHKDETNIDNIYNEIADTLIKRHSG